MASVSLVITTYNWKDALEQVLLSVQRQQQLPQEVIVADDGSREDTKSLVETYQQAFPCPLVHCWQEDDGFRLSAIRNKAIAMATADYIVIVDGDMVLHPRFVRDHAVVARPNTFVQGSRVITSPEKAQKMLQGDRSVHLFSAGISNRLNAINSPFLSRCVSKIKNSLVATRGCNFAAWRKDLIEVNGCNESFTGWGREDSELTARLLHSGKQRLKLKFMATAYHLYHNENSRSSLSQNDTVLAKCLEEKWVRCDNGLDKYLGA